MPLTKIELQPGINREVTTLAGKGGWFDCDKVRFRSGYPEKLGGWVPLTALTNTFLGVGRSLVNWVTLANEDLLGIGTHLKYYIERGGVYNDVTPLRTSATVATNAFTSTTGSGIILVNHTTHAASNGDFVTITTPDTTLDGAISDSDTTITVVSTSDYTAAGSVWVGDELITYSGKTATTFTGCTRGTGGTTAAAHASETIVYIDVGGISGSLIDGNHQVEVVDANSYNIVTTGEATADITTGKATLAYEVSIGSDVFTLGTGWGSGVWGGAPSTGWGQAGATGVGIQLRLWNSSNFGEWLIFGVRGGGLYVWKPDASPSVLNRATALTAEAGASDVPTIHNNLLVSDVSRFVICFGVNQIGETELDPMLVRWSDQESTVNWTPSISNQASFQRLSRGSYIVTAKQTRQEILVWTDTALYSMQYIGPPYVWGFTLLMDNISIASPGSVVVNDNSVIWMGKGNFYIYNGQVNTLPCTVRRFVFDNINNDQMYQITSGLNGVYDELWWFYPSMNSTEADRYVVYNDVENLWYYGALNRSAWLYSPIRQYPVAVSNGQVYYHESGEDDGETNPPTPVQSFIQSADIDIDAGEKFAFVWRMIPDISFDGSSVESPQATISLLPRQNPGTAYGVQENATVTSGNSYVDARTHTVQKFTQYVYTRARGRQLAIRIGSNSLGTRWRAGVLRLDVRADGRRM